MVKVARDRKASRGKRLLALTNLVGFCYFLLAVSLIASIGILDIIPTVCRGIRSKIALHYSITLFFFVNVIGNYVRAYAANNSLTTEDDPKQQKAKEPTGTRRASVPNTHRVSVPARAKLTSHMSWREESSCTKEMKLQKEQVIPARFGGVLSSRPHDCSCWHHQREQQLTRVCKVCLQAVPWRTHHCSVCDTCVIRRDHHCFFMSTCIGQHNQRYFVFLCLHLTLSAMYAMKLGLQYMSDHGVHSGPLYTSVFTLAYSVYTHWASSSGLVNGYTWLLVALFYACFFGGMFSFGFLSWELLIILKGKTTYEMRRGIPVCDKVSIKSRVAEVLGTNYIVTSMIPLNAQPHSFIK